MESESDHWEPELMESQLVGHDPDDSFEEIEDVRIKKPYSQKKNTTFMESLDFNQA